MQNTQRKTPLLLLCLLASAAALPSPGHSRQQSKAQPAQDASPPVVRVAFVGDILLEAPWQPRIPPAKMFADVKELLGQFDLVVGNLEQPLTSVNTVTPHKNPKMIAAGRDFVFRATSPQAAQALRAAGIRVAALANNHTMDYTEEGLLDTLRQLRAAGIVPVGAGKNLREAERVQVVKMGNLRLGFLSFSDVVPRYSWAESDRPGIASGKYLNRVKSAVRRARRQADILAVVFHWGEMFTREPNERQREVAAAAQSAGADLILGAHPHVLQGIGCLAQTPVVYSAGNFVFATRNPAARRSALFEIRISGAQVDSIGVVPVVLDGAGRPRPAEGSAAQQIVAEIKGLSLPLGTQFASDSAVCRH